MNQQLIDWNLERAAEELAWANDAQALLNAYPQEFAHERESVEHCRHMAGMHIASANAIIDKWTQIELLREAAAEIDQLRQQVDWVQAQPDAYEQQMEAITHAARNSYRRTFAARGNTITRADSFDSHLIWAALTYRDSVQADAVETALDGEETK